MAFTSDAAILYYVCLVVTGSFFLINLVTAVVFMGFDTSKKRLVAEEEAKAAEAEKLLMESPKRKNSNASHELTRERSRNSKSNKIQPAPIQMSNLTKNEGKNNKPGQIDEKSDNVTTTPVPSRPSTLRAKSSDKKGGKKESKRGDDTKVDIAPAKKETKKDEDDEEEFVAPDPGAWNYYFFKLCVHPRYQLFFATCIMLNTIVLATDYYLISDEAAAVLELFNVGFTWVFVVEMFVSMAGLGLVRYFQDSFNRFDVVVVTVSLVEFFSGGGSLTVLRSLRMLRLFKLLKTWVGLRNLLQGVLVSMQELFYFGLLTFVFVFCCSILGMEFFRESYPLDESSRAGFSNIGWSFLTVFQLITAENWNEIMSGGVNDKGWISAIYCICVVVMGNMIVLSIVLAILLSNVVTPEELNSKAAPSVFTHILMRNTVLEEEDEEAKKRIKRKKCCCFSFLVEDRGAKYVMRDTDYAIKAPKKDETKEEAKARKHRSLHNSVNEEQNTMVLHGNSMFLFSSDSNFRKKIVALITKPVFEFLVFVFIFIASICLCFDDSTVTDESARRATLDEIDLWITCFFTLEMVLKFIALGVFMHPHSYFRSAWNWLDFFCVFTSLAFLIFPEASGFSFAKSLRSFRALRPIRLITRWPSLKLVVDSLIAILPTLGNPYNSLR